MQDLKDQDTLQKMNIRKDCAQTCSSVLTGHSYFIAGTGFVTATVLRDDQFYKCRDRCIKASLEETSQVENNIKKEKI